MKQLCRFLAIMLLATLYACSQKQEFGAMAADIVFEESESAFNNEVSTDNLVVERKMIKEGEISFETSHSANTKEMLSARVKEFGCYIANDYTFDYPDKLENRVTIRVPSDRFELLLNSIAQHAKKLDKKSINAVDVTEEFIDVEARVNTKKELENRYRELLKKANKVEEIVAIEKEIGTLRTEIESIEGRLNYLKEKVAYSTLTVVFYEKTNSSFGFNSKFGQAIKKGWTNLLQFFVALTNIWPFVLLAVAIGIIISRRFKSKNRKKNAP